MHSEIDWKQWLARWDTQQTGYLPDREGRFTAMLNVLDVLFDGRGMMNDVDKRWYRIAGVLAVSSACIVAVSDLFMTYAPEKDVGVLDLHVLQFASWRLYFGVSLGVYAIPFYLLGYWLIFRALRPAGFRHAFPVVMLAGYSIAVGFSQVHAFFGIRGIMLQTGYHISPDFLEYYEPIMQKLTVFELPIIIFTYILGMAVPSLWIMVIILTQKTLYRKWMAFVNVFTVFVLCYLSRFLSAALGNILLDIAVNAGHAALFLMPTIVLWYGERGTVINGGKSYA